MTMGLPSGSGSKRNSKLFATSTNFTNTSVRQTPISSAKFGENRGGSKASNRTSQGTNNFMLSTIATRNK